MPVVDLVSTCLFAGYLVRYKSTSSELGYIPKMKDGKDIVND